MHLLILFILQSVNEHPFHSLFFNENRTIREVADFMHLAKSTVSSVVQVFKKEHRIQRKTSTGRKKKLSDEHEQMIMDILSQKEDITIEETRNRFLSLNPEVPNISKSTIYRIMENCQSKLVSIKKSFGMWRRF